MTCSLFELLQPVERLPLQDRRRVDRIESDAICPHETISRSRVPDVSADIPAVCFRHDFLAVSSLPSGLSTDKDDVSAETICYRHLRCDRHPRLNDWGRGEPTLQHFVDKLAVTRHRPFCIVEHVRKHDEIQLIGQTLREIWTDCTRFSPAWSR
jgi:hypothetical protein